MSMINAQFDQIGKSFVEQYYALFDNLSSRPNIVNFYTNESFMSFEGTQLEGVTKIMEKFASLSFKEIKRALTAIDCHPTYEGGVLISVLGRLQCDEDPPHPFHQVFVLKPLGGSFFCQHDIFRLGIHNTA